MDKSYFLDNVLELLYPSDVACCVCGKETHFSGPPYICAACKNELHFIGGKRIFAVGSKEMTLYYAFEYDQAAKQLIHDLKYNGKRYVAKSLAYYLNEMIRLNDLEYDIMTPVPLHKNRLKERGYNQCNVLCREMGKEKMKKYKEVLIRNRDTKMQSLIPAQERYTNILGAFDAVLDVKGKTILLIDDVVTSGSTMRENCNILYKNGANNVIGLAIAT